MKKHKNLFWLLVTAVCASIFMAGCKKVGDPVGRVRGSDGGTTVYKDVPTEITYFCIEFTSDMAPVVYEFFRKDNGFFFSSRFIYGDDEERRISEELFDKLASWVDAYNVKAWDGYHKSMEEVYDGAGFSLNITLRTDETISASGYMSYPDGYDEAETKLMIIIDEATKSVLTNSNM